MSEIVSGFWHKSMSCGDKRDQKSKNFVKQHFTKKSTTMPLRTNVSRNARIKLLNFPQFQYFLFFFSPLSTIVQLPLCFIGSQIECKSYILELLHMYIHMKRGEYRVQWIVLCNSLNHLSVNLVTSHIFPLVP